MDAAIVATVVGTGVTVVGVMVGGFMRMSARIGDSGKSIGKLEGKIDGLKTTMANFHDQLGDFGDRVGRLDTRINGIVSRGKK